MKIVVTMTQVLVVTATIVAVAERKTGSVVERVFG